MLLHSVSSSLKTRAGIKVGVLEIVICLLELIVKEKVVLRELEFSQVEFLNDIVSQYIG